MDALKIVAVARKYIGQHEKPQNSGFLDAEFEKRMRQVGWIKGQAWCAYNGELIWREACPERDAELSLLFSGSALQTLHNFKNAGWETGTVPKLGALAIFSHGRGPEGHLGVVSEIHTAAPPHGYFYDVEGNTNSQGGREGIEVAEKKRLLDQPFEEKGLNLVAFVYPKVA